jgi:hypothetical protein
MKVVHLQLLEKITMTITQFRFLYYLTVFHTTRGKKPTFVLRYRHTTTCEE